MKRSSGYRSPEEGMADRGGSYTVWVRLKGDSRWHSPKDISGVRRHIATHEHLRVLRRDNKKIEVVYLKQRSQGRPNQPAKAVRNIGRNSDPEYVRALFKKLVRQRTSTFPNRSGEPLEAPTEKGVYVILSPDGEPFYVGATPRAKRGIRQRLSDHLHGRSPLAKRAFDGTGDELRNGYRFRCLVVENSRHRALLEQYAVGRLCPEFVGHGDRTSRR